ncbi:MAG: ABC transporter substrate-binding protein [Bacteroidales bacterium]|nr:ABC transporter substrate-binding protein [Bacteroidales bacterium]
MRKNKKILGFTFIILIGFSAFFIFKKCQHSDFIKTDVADNVSVRMKWFYSGTMTGWFAGKEEGIFKDYGINLTINSGGPDNSSIKLVAAGNDIFGVAGADEVLIARNKGIPIVAIGVLFKDSPIGFISKKGKSIKTPSEWDNKIIEVDFGSNAEIQYRALIKKFDVKNIKEIPYSYSLVPFIEDKVDISVAYIMDQVVTLRKRGIELNVLTSKQYGINPYGDVIITSEKTLKENPDLVKRFLAAFIKSHQYAIENKEQSVGALIKNADNLKFENEIDVWNATIPFIIPDNEINQIGKMADVRWKATMNILVEFDVIPNNFDLSNAIFQER